jgi:ABC-2 type transport system permease protein
MMILLVSPIILLLLLGFAISMEVSGSSIAVCNLSGDETSVKMVKEIDATNIYNVDFSVKSMREIEQLFKENDIAIALIIPENFEADMFKTGEVHLQIITDATDPNQANMLLNYLQQILYNFQIKNVGIDISLVNIQPEIALLYNPLLKSSYLFVPGVMGLIMILICTMMTSIGIVREKETGTMELLLVSPIKPLVILLAKIVPYLVISSFNIVTILLLAKFVLGVPLGENVITIFLLSFFYNLTALSLGLLISSFVKSQIVAMLISAMGMMLPIMLLSGMVFPLESMPIALQYLSYIVPARYYIIALRICMIKGLGMAYVWQETLILLGMALVMIFISFKQFKTRLE